MNYDDQFLFNLIKKLQTRMAAVESRLGSISIVTNVLPPTSNISYIFFRPAPSTPEPVPPDPTKFWFLNFDDGSPGIVWDPDSAAWRY